MGVVAPMSVMNRPDLYKMVALTKMHEAGATLEQKQKLTDDYILRCMSRNQQPEQAALYLLIKLEMEENERKKDV